MSLKKVNAWGGFAIAVAIFAVSLIVGGVLTAAVKMAVQIDSTSILVSIGHTSGFLLAIVGAAIFYRAMYGGRPVFAARFSWRSAPMAVLGVVLIMAASIALEPLMSLFPKHYFTDLGEMIGSGVWSIVTSVVLAPVLEEIFFRGLLLEHLRRHVPAWQAVLAVALFFGLAHLDNWPQAINAAVLAVVMGYIYVRTGSLTVVIVVHAINNGIAYLQMETGMQDMSMRDWIPNDMIYWPVYALCVVLVVGSVAVMAMKAAKNDKKTLQLQQGENEEKLS
jgi:membrane protease YdiL (CAAX protease family)